MKTKLLFLFLAVTSFVNAQFNNPIVTQPSIINITGSSCTVTFQVNANGFTTGGYAEYSLFSNFTPSLGTTANFSIGSSLYFTNFSGNITGLLPGTLYYVRVIAQNNSGTEIQSTSFTTLPVTVPSISVSNVSPISASAATINYSLNANSGSATSIVKYGLSATALNSQVTGFSAIGNTATTGTATITNLLSGTQYFYEIEAANSAGTTVSSGSFQTGLPPQLLASYTFNNTLSDVNGANAFALQSGMEYGTNRVGVADKALYINGTGTTATITNLPVSNSSRTFSIWIKPLQVNTDNRIFSYGTASGFLSYGASFSPYTVYNFSNANFLSYTTSTPVNTWKHLVCTYEQTTGVAKIYLNGELKTSGTYATWNTADNEMFYLGSLFDAAGSKYFGFVDDLKIYNFAVSDTEAENLYNYNAITVPVAIAPVVSEVSSVAYSQTAIVTYTLNENYSPTTTIIRYGTSSTDLSSQITGFSSDGDSTTNTSTIDGLAINTQYFYQIEATNSVGTVTSTIENFTTVANLPTVAQYSFNNTLNNTNGSAPFSTNTSLSYVADRNANAASALRINGIGTSTVIPDLPTGTSPRTVSIWYKVSIASNDNCLFVYGQSGGQNAYGVSFNNANTWYNFAWNTNTPFTNTSNDGTWHHLVTTFDASKTSKVYVDGDLKATVVQNGWNTSVNGNTFWLAGLFSSGTSTFNGTVDDLQIFNFALTEGQVLNLYSMPTLSSQDFNPNNLEVALYPNPTNAILNIQTNSDIQAIEIYSIQGQKVLHATQKQINVSNLATGMYLIKILDAQNNVSTKKFMKN